MVAIASRVKLTFDEYLRQYPQGEGFFELVDGKLIRMEAIRAHKNISRFLMFTFNDEIRRLKLDYIVDKDIVIRTVNRLGKERGRIPDVSIVQASFWNDNVIAYGAVTEPLELAVEVVSTNWEDDYIDKLEEYETIGIKEYWIVDYLAIASRSYLGNPKVPMVFVYQLKDGKYECKSFKNNETIISSIFPELKLTIEEILKISGI
ncbi:Uma2 family endonuclease [Cyanobacterium aponinum]|uniref:Uma2 family endonuclease n=1 Tax=Cyanobacterium aponinum TaxID=379064 RepID=UPI000C12D4C0|nr:Uma2 family endonuclease [Cyanobacterium aponinum]PHV62807.1 hypothetical protein CSQ80_08820 [Cyanobacterium aponinum IPPAS B-1201]